MGVLRLRSAALLSPSLPHRLYTRLTCLCAKKDGGGCGGLSRLAKREFITCSVSVRGGGLIPINNGFRGHGFPPAIIKCRVFRASGDDFEHSKPLSLTMQCTRSVLLEGGFCLQERMKQNIFESLAGTFCVRRVGAYSRVSRKQVGMGFWMT